MDPDELLALDKDVLVDLILRLHERVAHGGRHTGRSWLAACCIRSL